MTPASPVIAWLNGAVDTVPGELRVVAGDMEGDSIGSWVKTLLSDAFYWTDNDLVVQTRSMYGGAPRAKTASGSGARFLLDQGGKVSHFNYFSNERTVQAIASALLDDRPPTSRRSARCRGPARTPAAHVRRSPSSARAARRSRSGRRRERPAVFVIPGILGSNLKKDGKRIWLGFRFVNGLQTLAWDPATAASVEPDGPIGSVYGDLIERLADQPRGDPLRLRLASADRGRGAPARCRGRRRADGARGERAAGAHPRPLDGRAASRARWRSRARHLGALMARDGARC